MLLENLTNDELIRNLQLLHIYLNEKYFDCALSEDIRIQVKTLHGDMGFFHDGSSESVVVSLEKLTEYKLKTRRIPQSSEKIQFQWIVTSMLHAMVDQYIFEDGEEDPDQVAERVGLMFYDTRTEWIDPLQLSQIMKEFHLEKDPELIKSCQCFDIV